MCRLGRGSTSSDPMIAVDTSGDKAHKVLRPVVQSMSYQAAAHSRDSIASTTNIRVEGKILKVSAACVFHLLSVEIYLPDHIRMEKKFADGSNVHFIDLADLSQLKSTRGSREQEAHDDEDRIVNNANRSISCCYSQQGSHNYDR